MSEVLQRLAMQKDVLDVISSSIAATLSQYIQLPTSVLNVQIGSLPKFKPAVAGAIRYESSTFAIELLLTFPHDFLGIPDKGFVMDSPADLTTKAQDLAGEVLNVAFGNIDPSLRVKGLKLRSSFPKTFSGSNLAMLIQGISEDVLAIDLKAGDRSFSLFILKSGSLKQSWSFTA